MNSNYPVHLIRCPQCRRALYLPKMRGFSTVTCPKCTSIYSLQEYQFVDKSVEQQSEETCLYRLRIRSEDGTEAISFRSKDPKLSFFQQDQLLVLRQENSIAFLKNLTEGWSEYFHDSETTQVMAIGVVSVLVGVVGYMVASWWGFISTPVIGGLSYWYINRRTKRRRLAMADQLQDAKIIQEDLSLVARDDESLVKINEELEATSFFLERCQAIRDDQSEFDLSERDVNILDRAIARLHESLGVMDSLKSQYQQRLNKIWLDIEIRNLTERMPDSIIENQLQSQELETQFQAELDAIAEVKTLFAQYGS